MIDVDEDTLKVLASYKVARAELSFTLAKADAYVFGDDDGLLRSPDAMTSRWDRRMNWLTKKYDTMHRVTIKGCVTRTRPCCSNSASLPRSFRSGWVTQRSRRR